MPGSVPGFGAGGTSNAYPSRALPEYGTSDYFRDMPADWVGGARGPAAIPSRTVVPNGPAAAQPLRGPYGPISYHRGAYIEDAGAPRLFFEGVLGHREIPWHRPTYANSAGRLQYRPPTHRTSWTANAIADVEAPASPIPVQNKHIGQFTVREEYGSTRQFFDGRSLAEFVASIFTGMDQQGRRWLAQAKTKNPWQPNLSEWGPAGSYGDTTRVLKTAPQSAVPASYNQYGAY